MRAPAGRLRRPIRGDGAGAAAAVGTVLLVVITVALVVVVGLFVFTLVSMPDDPPELDVNYVHLNDRWTVNIRSTSEETLLTELRATVKNSTGSFVMYDNVGDAVQNAPMVADLDEVSVASGDGPQIAPLVYLDADDDGRVSVGDTMIAYETYFFPSSPLLDASRGYQKVGTNPDGIPRDSTMQIVASPFTLGSSDIYPGDGIRVDIKHGMTLLATTSGNTTGGAVFMDTVWIDPLWATGNNDAVFTIRPGEGDEWSFTYSFRIDPVDPLTPGEIAAYEAGTHPFAVGDLVTLIHKPSNAVVLEFRL